MTTRELLEDMKAVLRRERWVPGEPGPGECCAVMALYRAQLAGPSTSRTPYMDACGLLVKRCGRKSLVEWNSRQTSVEAVIALVDQVIASLP